VVVLLLVLPDPLVRRRLGMNARPPSSVCCTHRQSWTWQDLLAPRWNMERPVLPAPHQIALDFWSSIVDWPLDSPRNLLFHVAVTARPRWSVLCWARCWAWCWRSAIVHSRTLDRALLPWIVASQTVPVLAIAPIVLVILGSLGMSGLAPKAVIAMYLSFFPVTVAMVQGLRSPQVIETEMMHTYAATRWQALWMLRLPAALPFLFPALRVGIAASLVGAMVAELPTGARPAWARAC
jgi:NitT/TauT family transport system permease protein